LRPTNNPRENGILEVYVFGLYSADAILITTENYVAMIDTGENQHGQYIVDRLLIQNIRHIDYLIITHFDRDHVGGAHSLIRNLDVRKIIIPNYRRESRSVERFREAVQDTGNEVFILSEMVTFTLDDVEFVIYPSQLEYFVFGNSDEDGESTQETPRENDFSIVVSVKHGENNFLFTGDAMAVRLEQLLEIDNITGIDFDFLKVPHHGRRNRQSIEFINTIIPRYAATTCCHERPTDERIIAALEYVGATIFFSKHGGILARSDGCNLLIKQ